MPGPPDLIVVNTGPIIALGLAGAADIVGRLPLRFLAPAEVAAEIEAGRRLGHPIDMPPWVSIEPLARPVSALGGSVLDASEAAVIQLALERQVGTVAIDEVRGRRAALAAGLRVTGSLGLLGRAKAIGLIPVVKPYVTAMRSAGIFLDDGLVEWFLKEMGETT